MPKEHSPSYQPEKRTTSELIAFQRLLDPLVDYYLATLTGETRTNPKSRAKRYANKTINAFRRAVVPTQMKELLTEPDEIRVYTSPTHFKKEVVDLVLKAKRIRSNVATKRHPHFFSKEMLLALQHVFRTWENENKI